MHRKNAGGLVYSTDGGRTCPRCRKTLIECGCKAQARVIAKGDGVVRVSRETKGRGGKTVTIVRGLDLDADALAEMGRRLRSMCGAGGTTGDGMIEVQGDHCERVMAWLADQGRVVKRAGG